jgi:hypothetical protein
VTPCSFCLGVTSPGPRLVPDVGPSFRVWTHTPLHATAHRSTSLDSYNLSVSDVKALQKQLRDQVLAEFPNDMPRGAMWLAKILEDDPAVGTWPLALGYTQLKLRRGRKQICRRALEWAAKFEADPELFSHKASFNYDGYLWILAWLDCKRSHACLIEIARGHSCDKVRAAALEFMAFEKRMFDMRFVLKGVDPNTPERELLSALYEIELKEPSLRPKQRLDRLSKLVDHPGRMVRAYVARALYPVPGALPLLFKLREDPEEMVRDNAKESINWFHDSHPEYFSSLSP